MADDQTQTETHTTGRLDRRSFLHQIEGEITKQRRESLKGKLKGLIAKKAEAERAVAVINKEIEEELNRFEEGL